MNELHKHNIRLSDGQKRKLRCAYKRQKTIVIGLQNSQLSKGNDKILLTHEQHRAVTKAIQKNAGVRLRISYDQLLRNKNGGLLKEVMQFIETDVPGGKRFISPLVRKQIAPLLRNRFIPWVKELIDGELDSLIKNDPTGSGLKRHINKKLSELLVKKNNAAFAW